jgi:uncharacterized membrane protein YjjP (DUF1212 family)
MDYHAEYRRVALKYGAAFVVPGVRGTITDETAYEEIIDLGKLLAAQALNEHVVAGRLPHWIGVEELRAIDRRPLPPRTRFYEVLYHAFGAAALAMLAFGASAVDLIPSFLLGGLFGHLKLGAAAPGVPAEFVTTFPFLASLLVSLVSQGIGFIDVPGHGHFCWPAVALGVLAHLVPAYSLFVAMYEIVQTQGRRGTIRLVRATLPICLVAVGLFAGVGALGLVTGQSAAPACRPSSSNTPTTKIACAMVFMICQIRVIRTPYKLVPGMLLNMVVPYLGVIAWPKMLPNHQPQIIGFFAAMVGCFWSYFLSDNLAMMLSAFGPEALSQDSSLYFTPATFMVVPGGRVLKWAVAQAIAAAGDSPTTTLTVMGFAETMSHLIFVALAGGLGLSFALVLEGLWRRRTGKVLICLSCLEPPSSPEPPSPRPAPIWPRWSSSGSSSTLSGSSSSSSGSSSAGLSPPGPSSHQRSSGCEKLPSLRNQRSRILEV